MKKNFRKTKAICFRQFNRKGYSVFNSLGKQVVIGVLAISCSIVGRSSEAIAQQANAVQASDNIKDVMDEDDPLQLEDVIVDGNTKPMVYSELSRVVTTLQRKDIEQLPVQSFQQLLESISSIDLRQRSGNDVQADISIRGSTYNQFLIMLNGVNITDPQTGHYNLDLPIDIESVERIEILQGTGARVLGPNAFAGAINIITATSDNSKLQARILGGQHCYNAQAIDGTLVLKKVKIFAAASRKQSDGYIENTDFNMMNAFTQVRYNGERLGNFNLQFGYQQKDYGANSFYSLVYPNQKDHTRTFLSSINYDKKFNRISLNASVYHRRNFNRYELFRDNPPDWYIGHNYHQTDVLGGSLTGSSMSILGKTSLGVTIRGEHIYSNALGDSMAHPKKVPFENATPIPYYTKEKLRKVVNWFVEHNYYYESFSISAGVMGNYCDNFGHNTLFGVDMSYALTNSIRLIASANQSLRMPTFTELFYSSKTHIGNPDLKPEKALTFELGARFNRKIFHSNFTVFYREGKNIIDWIMEPNDPLWYSRNHISLNTIGTEIDAEIRPSGFIKKIVKQARLSYTFLHMDKNNNGLESSKALDYLKHKFSISSIHSLPFGFGFSWSIVGEWRAGKYTDFNTANVQPYPGVVLLDARVFWSRSFITLFVDGSNLLNKKYFDYANVEQAGRWITVGANIKINGK